MFEILDGCAFAQELRVGGNGEIKSRAFLADDPLDFVTRADGYGRFRHNDRRWFQGMRDLACSLIDVAKVSVAVAASGGCSDGDEDCIRAADRPGKVGCESQASILEIVGNQRFQPWLENRYLPAFQGGNLGGVIVDARYGVAEIGQARTGDEPHISGADDGNFQGDTPHKSVICVMRIVAKLHIPVRSGKP
jgi:hypothetical protein